jgi:hypothetical protein
MRSLSIFLICSGREYVCCWCSKGADKYYALANDVIIAYYVNYLKQCYSNWVSWNSYDVRDPRSLLEPSWNVVAHGDAREGKWRGNWWMECVSSTLHTTSELGVSSITTADPHTSAASSRLNWHPCRVKWTRPFRRKTKSGFYACAITFQMQSTTYHHIKTLVLFTDKENIPVRVGVPDAVREKRYSLRWTTGLLLIRATSSNWSFATNLAHAHMSPS